MARLIAAFIRHADYQQLPDTPSAHQPFPLKENGIAQATAAAEQLVQFAAEKGWQILPVADSSHLLRAWQTAQIIQQQLARQGAIQLTIDCFEALAERGVGSCVANLTLRQIEDILDQDPRFTGPPWDWKSNSRYCLPFSGAESLLTAGKRVADHVVRRMAELRHGCTTDSLKLFIGHGAAFRHAAYQLGILEFDEIAKFSMFHARPVYLEYLAKAGWRHVAGEWKVRANQESAMD